MATPTPVFPAAVATDAQLKVANNLITATVRVAIDAVNTVIFVDSTAGFGPNMLVSIDKEILAIGSVVPTPNPALIVATGGRGFDGTTAAGHSAGAKVQMLIDAWHHNALAAEIKAIENTLGPNLSNVATRVIWSTDYDFTPLIPGGSLIVGLNVVTIAPVPKGVNGTDANHYLYIDQGSGTAEVVLIAGGTAISGAASGTLFLNCSSAHSGSWRIRSATAGIQEANIVNLGSLIYLPAGNVNVYSKITLSGNGGILGQGKFSTQLLINYTAGNIIEIGGAAMTVAYLGIVPNAGGMSSGVAINTTTTSLLTIADCYIGAAGGTSGVYIGIHSTGKLFLRNVEVIAKYRGVEAVSTAPFINGLQVLTDNTNANFPPSSCALYLKNIAGGFIQGFIHDAGIFDKGIIADTAGGAFVNEMAISDLYLDNYATFGIQQVSTGNAVHWQITNFRLQDNSGLNTGFGIYMATGAANWTISNGTIGFGGADGIIIDGSSTDITLSNILSYPANSAAVTSGKAFHISAGGSPKRIKAVGCTFGRGVDLGTGLPSYGFLSESTTLDTLTMTGNTIQGNGNQTFVLTGSETNLVIANNNGVDNVIPTVASAATITAPIFPLATSFKLSGTTTVTAINGFWAGRTIRILYPSGAGITVMGRALAAGSSLTLTSDGSSNIGWY